ncbi:REP-associated tyrosine transposase [Aquisphaera insulae]|uniref:REP-associated tyrosine transposase n=1 Tax=Aquisphaera insulae TaxID=2712864 RepID=UPI0013EDBF90|nr:transposase [Aquisphaera insulae]
MNRGQPPEPAVQRTWRHLPHWELSGSTYFVTFRLSKAAPPLSPEERTIVLEHIRSGGGTYYRLSGVVVMPDHVHLVLRPESGFSLSRILKGIKGVSGRLLNQRRGVRGAAIWQDESWDRIMRDEREYLSTLEYLMGNPIRAGLCQNPDEYPWLYREPEP